MRVLSNKYETITTTPLTATEFTWGPEPSLATFLHRILTGPIWYTVS